LVAYVVGAAGVRSVGEELRRCVRGWFHGRWCVGVRGVDRFATDGRGKLDRRALPLPYMGVVLVGSGDAA